MIGKVNIEDGGKTIDNGQKMWYNQDNKGENSPVKNGGIHDV